MAKQLLLGSPHLYSQKWVKFKKKKTTTALKQQRISFDFIIFYSTEYLYKQPYVNKIHFLRGQKTK